MNKPGMTIHTPIESPSRVDKKYVVFKNVYFEATNKCSLFNSEYFAKKSNDFRQEMAGKCQFSDDRPKI